MVQIRLEDIPPEILDQICIELQEKDPSSLISLSMTSKQFRSIAIPSIFERLRFAKPVETDDGCSIWRDSRLGILRTLTNNPEIAAQVKEIIDVERCDSHLTKEEFERRVGAVTSVGIVVPEKVTQLTTDPCSNFALLSSSYKIDGKLLKTFDLFMSEIILALTPNLRTLEYGVSWEDPEDVFQTLYQASSASVQGPLLSKLVDCVLDMRGPANLAQPLAYVAPNLDSLWLNYTRGLEAPIQFQSVRVLIMTLADLTATEVSDFIRGFPRVTKFWYGSYSRSRYPSDGREICKPQEVIDALMPLQSQLLELTMRFDLWQQYNHLPSDGGSTPGLVTSVKGFKVLEHLDLDGACLWDRRRGNTDDAQVTNFLATIVPKTVKKLTLVDLRHGPFKQDLLVFTRHAKFYCPGLKLIQYQLVYTTHFDKEWIEQCIKELESHGVAIENMADAADEEDNAH